MIFLNDGEWRLVGWVVGWVGFGWVDGWLTS